MFEVYGRLACAFAWRVRFAAHEKGAAYQWIPVNVPHPDERVARHDPEGKSPLIHHDGLRLAESLIIEQYVDEAFPGRPLQAASAAERALARMLAASFDVVGEVVRNRPDEAAMEIALANALKTFANIDAALAGKTWLDGQQVGLTDIALLPLLATLELQGHRIAPRFARLVDYWQRGHQHPGLRATSPTVAPMQVG